MEAAALLLLPEGRRDILHLDHSVAARANATMDGVFPPKTREGRTLVVHPAFIEQTFNHPVHREILPRLMAIPGLQPSGEHADAEDYTT
jgi:hypothetical protein